MDERQIQATHNKDAKVGSRLLLGTRIAFTLIYGAGLAALGIPPAASETGSELVDWLRTHRDGVQWFVWTITASMPLGALAFALLRRLLPPPQRDMYFIGAITILITNAVQAWFWAGLALHADRLAPTT